MSLGTIVGYSSEDTWLDTSRCLWVRRSDGTTVKLRDQWHHSVSGFVGVEEGTTMVKFVPMTSVIEAWQHTASLPQQLPIEYEPEPF